MLKEYIPEKDSPIIVASGGGSTSIASLLWLKKRNYNVRCFTVFDESCEEHKENLQKICRENNIPFYYKCIHLKNIEQLLDTMLKNHMSGFYIDFDIIFHRDLLLPTIFDISEKNSFLVFGYNTKLLMNIETLKYYLIKSERVTDQSALLFYLDQEKLRSIYLPLSTLSDMEVRELIKKFNIPQTKNSFNSSFLKKSFYTHLTNTIPEDLKRKGKIVDINGNILEEHTNIYNFQIGEPLKIKSKIPLYVIGFSDTDIVAGPKEKLLCDKCIIYKLKPLENLKLEKLKDINIKVGNYDTIVKIWPLLDSRLEVSFKTPVIALKGQTVVFYEDNMVLGGGIIEEKVNESGI